MDFKNKQRLSEEIGDLSIYLERIGHYKLASQVRNEQFLSRMLDANLTANRWEFESDFLERREKEIQSILIDFQSTLFDKSQNYNNIVVTLGYAGFFAIWNYVNDLLVEFDKALIALCLGVSLLVFILWTLLQSQIIASYHRRAAAVLDKEYDDRDTLLKEWNAQQSTNKKTFLKLQKVYPIVFFLTAGPALIAGIILMVLLGSQILLTPTSLQEIFTWVFQALDLLTNKAAG